MDVKLFSTIIYALSCFVAIYALVYLAYNYYKHSKFRRNSIRKFRKHLAKRVFRKYPEIEEVLEEVIDAINDVVSMCEYPLSILFDQENIIRNNLYKATPAEREHMIKALNNIKLEINNNFSEYVDLVERSKNTLRKFYLMACQESTAVLNKRYMKLWIKSGYSSLISTLYDYYIHLYHNITSHKDSGFDFIDHIILE